MNNQKGFAPLLLILLAAAGVVAYLLVSSSATFKGKLFSLLYPKPASHAQEKPNAVPNEILFKFKEGVGDAVKDSVRKQHGLTKLETIPKIEVERVKVPEQARDKVIEALNKNPNIEYAEPNFIRKLFLVQAPASGSPIPNDPSLLDHQWNLSKIQTINSTTPSESVWYYTAGSSDVKIAILDSGIDETHEDLAGKVVARENFVSSGDPPNDVIGHGTIVAGVAAAATNNGKGITGSGFHSSLMNVKVAADDGSLPLSSRIAQAVIWAADNGANVINMSYGSPEWSSSEADAVTYAWGVKGVVLVAAAGNDGNSVMNFPAAYPEVIAVAATNSSDSKSNFSSYGTWVDVAAPGESIYSTQKGNTYGSVDGTSFASPHVAGEAALIWAKGACSTNKCVRSQIETKTDPISGTGTYWQWGRINAYKAVYNPITILSTDITNPTTSITSPGSGSTVSGTVTIQASASDNVGVNKVEFYVDNKLFKTDLTSPYSASWSTTKFVDGSHILKSKAYDAAYNTGTSAQVTVTVKNTTPTPTPILGTQTFGKTTIGSTKGTYGSNQWGIKAQLTQSGQVSSIKAYLAWDGGGSNNVKAVIYKDNAGSPGNKVAESSITTFTTTPSWVTFTFSPAVSLTAGTYWLSVLGQESGVYGYYDVATSNINFFKDSAPWPTAMDPAIGVSLSTHYNSVYASYTTSSSPTPTPAPSSNPTPKPSSTPTTTPTPSPGTLSWSVSATPVCPYQNIKVTWSYTGTLYKSFKPQLLDSLSSTVAGSCSSSLNSSYTFLNKTIGGGHAYSVTLQSFTDITCTTIYSAPNKSVTQASCSTPSPTPIYPTPTYTTVDPGG